MALAERGGVAGASRSPVRLASFKRESGGNARGGEAGRSILRKIWPQSPLFFPPSRAESKAEQPDLAGLRADRPQGELISLPKEAGRGTGYRSVGEENVSMEPFPCGKLK